MADASEGVTPPTDHGSDRYDYVEVQAPAGVEPSGHWFDWLLTTPVCPDCRANLFLRYDGGAPDTPTSWFIEIAHDDTCPLLAQLEAG